MVLPDFYTERRGRKHIHMQIKNCKRLNARKPNRYIILYYSEGPGVNREAIKSRSRRNKPEFFWSSFLGCYHCHERRTKGQRDATLLALKMELGP